MTNAHFDLATRFSDPPREFGVIPFWLWNDDLKEQELLRQIRAFHAAGFGGFVPHARIGLSRRIGYLTEEFFRLLRLAVAEAARLNLQVVLYDEGSYPSGSAQGRVVAENPAYAARCLIPLCREINGPARGFWRPNPGRAMQDRLVCVVQAREITPGTLDPTSLGLLLPQQHELVNYQVPEGHWRLIACWDVFSGGTIRGVYEEEEDSHALAPAAADILNPDAVACFLRHTHEQYYAHLREYWGTTIVGMFTDEPNPLGRSPKRGPDPKPYTPGFLDDVQAHWTEDVRLWLPALWFDYGPRTSEFRRVYARTVAERLERVFYGAQSRWCAEHGIALTGHPARSDEMSALRLFHWPGQDMVWRYVEPRSPTALEGPHSVAAKVASSAAAIDGRRRNATEIYGAYGWQLNLDEAKWLADWHLVRGNNLFIPHACFYSLRGRRAFESEPDLGLHNCWWPHFHLLSDYIRRTCWVLSEGDPVYEVGILTDPDAVRWAAARELYESHISFVYLYPSILNEARIEEESLVIGACRLRAIVPDPPQTLHGYVSHTLEAFRRAGGLILDDWPHGQLGAHVAAQLGRELDWPHTPTLRMAHYRKDGREIYFLVNEGEDHFEGELSLRGVGALTLWDALDGCIRPWPALPAGDRTQTWLRLERRQGLFLVLDPAGAPDPTIPLPPLPGEAIVEIGGPWRSTDLQGRIIAVPCPGNWAQTEGWETFSGTLVFSTEFVIPKEFRERELFLDLGHVGDIAEVWLNGVRVAVRAWAPYTFAIGTICSPGTNSLEIRVTNSIANAYDGLQLPSGLMGPVCLRKALQRSFAKVLGD